MLRPPYANELGRAPVPEGAVFKEPEHALLRHMVHLHARDQTAVHIRHAAHAPEHACIGRVQWHGDVCEEHLREQLRWRAPRVLRWLCVAATRRGAVICHAVCT